MTTRPFLTPRNMAIASSWLRPCRLRLLTATISSPGKGIMIALVPAHYVGPPGQVGNARNQESRPPPLICIYAHGKTFHCRANDGFCLPPDFAYSSLAKLVSIAFRPVTHSRPPAPILLPPCWSNNKLHLHRSSSLRLLASA